MWGRKLTEWGPILSGETSNHYLNKHYNASREDYARWVDTLELSPTGKAVLEYTEDSANFFFVEKDLAMIIPSEQQIECFYALKNGFVAPNCPSRFIYFASRIFDRYQVCNLIAPMLPNPVGKEIDCRNYFGADYTAVDVLRNFVHEGFQPITPIKLIVDCGDWFEAYAPRLDKLVILPTDIGKKLTSDDMEYVDLSPEKGLTLDNVPLEAIGGAAERRGVYDLRRAV